ncbi:MAG: histidine phosphatase family protein [Proteobacteria bacterium]|nr:histidine phosphatase family protein [Pseudomonadota bacterium]MBU1687136.1 histidine phosphatase family protein [Pseudomonadota bacterium]
MIKKILLVRHGSTGTEYAGRFIGSSDIPLGAKAPEEVARLAEVLKPLAPEVTFHSPLGRVQQTVSMLGSAISTRVFEDPDLREIDFGRWEGKRFTEIAEGDSELVKRWSIWNHEFAFPEGEAVVDFLDRVGRVAEKLVGCREERILVVAHGGVIRALICHLLKIPSQNYLLFDIQPARLTTLDLFPEGGVLTGLNL